jgi:hypothetical protein
VSTSRGLHLPGSWGHTVPNCELLPTAWPRAMHLRTALQHEGCPCKQNAALRRTRAGVRLALHGMARGSLPSPLPHQRRYLRHPGSSWNAATATSVGGATATASQSGLMAPSSNVPLMASIKVLKQVAAEVGESRSVLELNKTWVLTCTVQDRLFFVQL